jgi:hypothetical protein
LGNGSWNSWWDSVRAAALPAGHRTPDSYRRLHIEGLVSVKSLSKRNTPITPTTGDVSRPGKYPRAGTASMGCAIPFASAAIAKNQTGNRAILYPLCRPRSPTESKHRALSDWRQLSIFQTMAKDRITREIDPQIAQQTLPQNEGIAPPSPQKEAYGSVTTGRIAFNRRTQKRQQDGRGSRKPGCSNQYASQDFVHGGRGRARRPSSTTKIYFFAVGGKMLFRRRYMDASA